MVAAFQQASSNLREQLTSYVTALWQSLGIYRAEQIPEFVKQVLPVVQGAMSQMQAYTSAYLGTLSGATPVASQTVTVKAVRNGTDPAEVYGRPFHTVWRQLANLPRVEGSIEQAIEAGSKRAVQTAVTDLQLAKTHTAQGQLKQARNIVGYRRQLEGAHSCALCIVASTRRYHQAELMPMHPACDCTPVPIYGGEPITPILDPALLATLHDTVAQQFGADSTAARNIRGAFKDDGSSVLYRDVLITHDHGELGPILGVRGQHFVGPSDVAA